LSEIILSGGSAGAVGSMMNLDWLDGYLNTDQSNKSVRVTGLPFSGMFVGDITDYDGSQ
jgi:hypothetical protein